MLLVEFVCQCLDVSAAAAQAGIEEHRNSRPPHTVRVRQDIRPLRIALLNLMPLPNFVDPALNQSNYTFQSSFEQPRND